MFLASSQIINKMVCISDINFIVHLFSNFFSELLLIYAYLALNNSWIFFKPSKGDIFALNLLIRSGGPNVLGVAKYDTK